MLSLFETGGEGLWFMNDDNAIQFYNNSFYQQFSLSTEGSTLEHWLALVHPEDREKLRHEVNSHQQKLPYIHVTRKYRVRNLSGCYLWIESTSTRVEYQDGFAMVGSHKNVSEDMFLNQYLKHIAIHDCETGLPNRHQFLENIPSLNEKSWILVCCLTQLQQFQRRVVYEAIAILSSTLVSTLDEVLNMGYELYQISADVFVATIKQNIDAETSISLQNQIESTFHQACNCNSTLTPKLGLGAIPVCDLNLTRPLEQVFNISEYARVVRSPVTYTGELRHNIDRYFLIQDALEAAIDIRQITIALQPIVQAITGVLISFEALARWEHPELGNISPAEFIPIAEQLGHIHTLGMLILEHTCQYLVMFDAVHQTKPLVNVNVSAHQLLKRSFVDDVCDIVAQFGVSPSRIVLEVTESYLLDEESTITTTLNLLHAHGFKLSIDDFGAGKSSITSLFQLPLYQVKLDRALVHEAMQCDACLRLITHLCEFADTYNITLVAEGVETSEMFKTLTKVGVTYIQGYYLYRPCSPKKWLKSSP